ncbi:MAG TPA: hypothetical protein VML91_01680 [Burkholderiales bacterium]|nr:hypothetical protein [Burkholderiales bacterium]
MNSRPIPAAAALATFVLLAACEHQPPPPVAMPPQQVETGSRLTLSTPLSFPPGRSELLFQNEQVVPSGKLSRDMPYCKLTPESGNPGTIAPGSFTVGAVNYDEREIGTTSGMVSVTRIALATDPNRPGYTLQCGWPQGAPMRGFLTTEQIYNAIGGKYFTMNLLR